ncbi:MAG: GNAT family N-acetyltransferase [Cardiobacteriaceae bacterium]|nr:GNAT family N-acetyltransferase [Cardiobacteriaceae bacterium]
MIEQATLTDLPAIVEIYNSTIASRQSTADLQPVTLSERQTWFASHNDLRPIYVYRDANDIVCAWGSFSDYYPRAAYHISAEISIYVHADKRGQGLGRQMLDAMLMVSPTLGIRNVLAVIFAHNAASIRLFEAAGFSSWGRLPQVCDLQDFIADIVILGKTL